MIHIIFLLLLFSSGSLLSHPHIITNGIEGWRRLGDNITTISKMCYFSEKFDLPMYYSSFEYSNSFAISKQLPILTDSLKKQFSQIIIVRSIDDIDNNINEEEPILFVCTFLSNTPWIYEVVNENTKVGETVKNLFTPLDYHSNSVKNSDHISIALHVRKGGGFDWPLASAQEFSLNPPLMSKNKIFLLKKNPSICCDDIWPINYLPGPGFITATKELGFKKTYYADYIWTIKFPPDQYYIEQLKFVLSRFTKQIVTIHLYTDDPEPENIINRYKDLLNHPSTVSFNYRKSDNQHNKNVIEDLMAIAESDVIIAANSSFAFAASLLGNHSLIIMPEHAITLPDKVIIDKVKVIESIQGAKKKIKTTIMALNNFLY